jgi:diguanylate cyclase (GGDEF)-like protein
MDLITSPEMISILVVDDDSVDRELVVHCLREVPGVVRVTQANSLAAAQEKLSAAGAFDIIIVDYRLGDGEGLEIIGHLGGPNNTCPVILVTGFNTERGAVAAIRRGVYDYIPKAELDPARLAQVVAGGLRWSAARAQLLESERELRRRSLYDSLTELPNRNLFHDRLAQACANNLRYKIPFGVLMMDLDQFKAVNDTLGHAAGDQVLQHAGKRLSAACRASDTVARLAGDEFTAICLGADTPDAAMIVAEKMLTAMRVPMIVQERALLLGISIGVAICPLHGTTPERLLAAADKSMYRAKTGLSKIVCAVAEDQTPAPPPPQALLNELDLAIKNREFVMYYQPKINLRTQHILGAEALMRWPRPGGLVVEPDRFIPVIEQSDILAPFTFMSIDLALEQMVQWRLSGIMIDIAVNISARMLEDDGLAHYLNQRLEHYRIAPNRLTLEITETAIIAHPEAARKIAQQIADIGINLSLDDFGAGFTSFTHLQHLAIPEIKLDKNFIIGLKPDSFGASLVKCVSIFCASEGIRLVAEGVEHKEVWPLLCELGCDIGQGFSIASPVCAADFQSWLADAAATQTARPYAYDA